MSTLHATLLGEPRFTWLGEEIRPRTRKAFGILVWLAAERRPQSREAAAVLLWGPGRLRNLRQELYTLRKLPGAEEWLDADDPLVLRCTSDLEALRGPLTEPGCAGLFAEGLDDIDAPGFQDWLQTARERTDAARSQAAVAGARQLLEAGDAERGWALVEPLLEQAAQGSVWRVAIALRLRMGDRPGAASLWDGAGQRFDRTGPEWQGLSERLHGATHGAMSTLSDPARLLLRLAALDPLPLITSVLEEASGLSPEALMGALIELHEAGLLREGTVANGLATEIRDGLAAPARAALHGRLAVALDRTEAPPDRVAPHLEAAGLAASARWLAAARRTGREGAVEAAVRTARTPSEATDSLSEGVMLARRRGDLPSAREWWARLEDHAVRTQDSAALLATWTQRALIDGLSGELEAAGRAADRAEILAGKADPRVLAVRGALRFLAGQVQEAWPLLEAGLSSPDTDLRLMALNAQGAIAGLQGRVEEADQLHRQALVIAREQGRLHAALRLLNSAGGNALRRGDLGLAVDWLDQARRLSAEIGDREPLPQILFNLVNAWLGLGAFGLARPVVAEMVALQSTPRMRGLALRVRADLERGIGRNEEAAAWSLRAIDAFEQSGDPVQVVVSRFNHAIASWLSAPSDEGLERLREAHDAVRALDRPDLADAAAELALVEPDPERVRALVPAEPSSELEWAAWLRSALLSGTAGTALPARVGRTTTFSGAYLDALAAHALDGTDPARASVLREGLNTRLTGWCEGLLGSQQEALQARVGRWLEAPLKGM